MRAIGWALKTPHRLRDFIELAIMLKVLYHFEPFYRSFFDNKYKVS